MRSRVLAFLGVILLASCGGATASVGPGSKESEPPSSNGSGSGASTGQPGSATDAGPTTPPPTSSSYATRTINCPWEDASGSGPKVSFEIDCQTDADCAIGTHLADCCGSLLYLGVNVGDKPRFDPPGICGGEGAACDCRALPPKAEDGQSSKNGGSDIFVRCTASKGGRICATYVMP
jgi:hypothetical protein